MSRGVGELNPKPLNPKPFGLWGAQGAFGIWGSGSGSRGRGCFCTEDFLHFSAGPGVRELGPTTDAGGLNVSVLGGCTSLRCWAGRVLPFPFLSFVVRCGGHTYTSNPKL